MLTVMVLNSKGGSGKTTLATNLAGYYASKELNTVVKDYDPQGSSSEWLRHRPYSKPHIHGIEAHAKNARATRAWQMRLPTNADRLIIDTPAGVDLYKINSALKDVDRILIPVSPSPIDIRATAIFIRDLHAFFRMYPSRAKVGIIANRVQKESPAYYAMQRIFSNLDISFIAVLSQNETYMQAAEHGVSVLELNGANSDRDKEEWRSLIEWVEEASTTQASQSPSKPNLYAVR
ncbi:MAG: ParA family protein [Gammaproteobacteria bacterium]|nr:ParA family protein [Gammaproteobacteria bacterium]